VLQSTECAPRAGIVASISDLAHTDAHQVAVERRCDAQDILSDECLETLSCMPPNGPYTRHFARAFSQRLSESTVADPAAFKEVLVMGQELNADAAHRKWMAFGSRFLHITSKYYAMMSKR
jgi:hypothetical protein